MAAAVVAVVVVVMVVVVNDLVVDLLSVKMADRLKHRWGGRAGW